MLKLPKTQVNHEELFMQRYERLRGWAMKLVSGDQQRAEDLLHDTFIHFMLHRAATENALNLDAYLHTMLRNLHLSQARRLARTPQGHLSLLDYDSADLGLQSVDPRDLMKVQDELRTICRYSCMRKETSKAASALILRYFHGYYPAEIARILNSPRAAIDGLLRNARNEARLFLQNPEALTFFRAETVPDLPSLSFGRIAPDILAELRQTIFDAPRGDCPANLEAFYAGETDSLVDAHFLSHLASCARCLDLLNEHLGLPLLATRQFSESVSRDKRPRDGGGPTSGGPTGGSMGSSVFLKQSRRRTKHVFEHRPKELHISFNGFVLGTQTVSSRHSELTLNVNLDEKIAFIEVYSERDVRLFFLNVEMPPEGPVDQLSSVELSDGRSLALALNFSETWPQLHAVYSDPTLAPDPVDSVEGLGANNLAAVSAIDESPQLDLQETPSSKFSLFKSLKERAAAILRQIVSGSFWFRPATATAVLAALLIAVGIFIGTRRVPVAPLSAATLLAQSASAEEAISAKPNQVIHRTIDLDVSVPRAVATGSSPQLIARHRIEIYQSTDRGLVARRLYDEKGSLMAGDWRRSDGVQTLYHHGAPPKLQLKSERAATLNFDDAWLFDPSAKAFTSLIHGTQAGIEERGNTYVISADVSTASGSDRASANTSASSVVKSATRVSTPTGRGSDRISPSIVKATLVLNKSDLHPIEQTLVIAQGNETREYKFIETAFDQKALNTAAPSVFEPEPELLSSAKPETRNPKPETSSPLLLTLPVAASPALEVEVLRLLNQAGADMGEQVSVTWTREGSLRVAGVVNDAQRKAEILYALNSVKDNPAVRVEIETVADALKRQKPNRDEGRSQTTIEAPTLAANSIPADAELRRYFSGRGVSGAQLEDSISGFANQTLNRSQKVMLHAWALKRLGARFSADELRSLDPDARGKWLALIRQHAEALARGNEVLRRDLSPVFAVSSAGEGESFAINSDDDLIRAIERLFEVCAANDRVVRQAFAITPDGSKDSTIKTPQFWRSLKSAEALAASIAKR